MSLIRHRKVTQNQSRRIAQQQTQAIDDAALATGVIVSHFGKQLDVQLSALPSANTTDNDCLSVGEIYRCHARTNLPMLSTGDKVQFSYDAIAALGRIERLLPRHTLITRPDRYHKVKPVAANVDLLVIVFAPLPKPATSLIDRYLLISHITGVPALLLLNKSDILDAHPEALSIYQEYQALGVDALCVSSERGDGMAALKSNISDKLAIFAGQSGVGKSSLINQLLPHAMQDTNTISKGSQLGQHTTTTSRLLAYDPMNLDKGGIIDTPGIREYGIWHLSGDDILGAFDELFELAQTCRFRDCSHDEHSKGCALWAAAASGQVLPRRILSLNQLQAESTSAQHPSK